MNILVTGGLGFIGSHTVVELINNNYNVIILDNLSNSKIEVLDKIYSLVCNSKSYNKTMLKFYEGNILNNTDLINIFLNHNIDIVIHFAAFKSVNESIEKPLNYYKNNVTGTLNLLETCQHYCVKYFIFSSSATVYGSSKSPLYENSQIGIGITNPYGQSKYMIENILQDISKSKYNKMKIISLRYFNPVGAHPSGLLGEDPDDIPNNLMPYVIRVAIKNNLDSKLDDIYNYLSIFGDDYSTEDGTAKRDFIHVVDLADAHIAACKKIVNLENNYEFYNIGTGNGISVLEIVNTFIKINKIKLPYKIKERREGDLDIVYCNTEKANKELNWKAIKTLKDIRKDTYNFAKKLQSTPQQSHC